MGMVLRPRARRAFIRAAVAQRSLVRMPHRSAVSGQESDHLAVAGLVRLPVMRPGNHEEGACTALAVPAGPRFVGFAEATLNAKALHQGAVKMERAVEITNAQKNMRKHVNSLWEGDGSGSAIGML